MISLTTNEQYQAAVKYLGKERVERLKWLWNLISSDPVLDDVKSREIEGGVVITGIACNVVIEVVYRKGTCYEDSCLEYHWNQNVVSIGLSTWLAMASSVHELLLDPDTGDMVGGDEYIEALAQYIEEI